MTEPLITFYPSGWLGASCAPSERGGLCEMGTDGVLCPEPGAERMWIGCEHEHLGSDPMEMCGPHAAEIRRRFGFVPTVCAGCGASVPGGDRADGADPVTGEPIQWLASRTFTVASGTPVAARSDGPELACLSSVHLPAERRDGTPPPPAVYVGRFGRSCGHAGSGRAPGWLWVELCVACTARCREFPSAERATPCPTCGEVGPVVLVAVRDINVEAMYG